MVVPPEARVLPRVTSPSAVLTPVTIPAPVMPVAVGVQGDNSVPPKVDWYCQARRQGSVTR